ncbi:glucosamine-6-phosphate deaminase NagB-II [Shewanella sp. HL-SH8]|jgi:glucosamine--fructose-6-phosphate aminotransferase (isomerizing)|uniref:glucosamine-6-phosphate deaminase NagB-II n=1 Tax=Shewanella TaxID=22 RepID=UPI001CF91171|nr:SIS domain-containing protein [Shewanella glacialimarina]UCX03943.1 SIS domain-containing protein [Shewanella glacialimarina]
MTTNTIMEQEARTAPQKIAEQLKANESITTLLGEKLREFKPKFVMIVGRGSSDHAGVFAKYLFEIEAGIPTFAAAPSVASVYGKTLQLEGGLVIVISQSGRSPDILAQARMAKNAGAYCVALVNDETAPIKDIVDVVVPLRAGEEKAVAATKSYLATLSAILQVAAKWTQSESLAQAVDSLPQALQTAVDAEPQLTAESLDGVKNLVVLGRGLGYAVSKEIALKMKEVCSIHAEAFSSAEFLHGPVTLVEKKLAIVDVCINDESYASHVEQIDNVKQRGADLVHLNQTAADIHPRVAPLALLQRFYIDVAAVAIARGINPDQPAGLKKVTQTL